VAIDEDQLYAAVLVAQQPAIGFFLGVAGH
jgi:hypothetical protein